VCPYDEGFRKYIFNAFRTVASASPDHIMLDDDFRLIGRYGGGCTCPLHMKRFNELAGTNITREELLEIFESKGEKYEKYSKIFIQTQKEAVIQTAHIMREAIDSVDPSIPGSFCSVGQNAEFADEIAQIMAGKGNPVVLRINNGQYTAAGTRYFTRAFFRAAAQIAKMKNSVDIILAETDTCPQTRYSTSASFLHTHFTGSILEGCAGAKQWITKLNTYEPQSGVAYRKILKKYDKFYTELANTVSALKWRGFRMPVLKSESFTFPKTDNLGDDEYSAWGECAIERLGLPMYFSADKGGVLCLEGKVKLTDDEIVEALKSPVIIASDSLEELHGRGFGKHTGVSAREWNGKQPMGEKILVGGGRVPVQNKLKELVPASTKTMVSSEVYSTVDKVNFESLFPGAAVYQNELGGTVYAFAGTPRSEYGLGAAFSFLSLSRKKQLCEILRSAGELPAYFPGDEEVYFRCADSIDGELFCSVINIGLDPIEKLELWFEKEISVIEKLMPDGTRKVMDFSADNGTYTIDTACNTLEPIIIFAK